MDFTTDRLNPYATTPPQVMRTIRLSRELQLVHQNQLHRCVPLVHAIKWIFTFVAVNFSLFHCLTTRTWNLMNLMLPAGTIFMNVNKRNLRNHTPVCYLPYLERAVILQQSKNVLMYSLYIP